MSVEEAGKDAGPTATRICTRLLGVVLALEVQSAGWRRSSSATSCTSTVALADDEEGSQRRGGGVGPSDERGSDFSLSVDEESLNTR
jgi:hypothetical protein